MRVAFLFDNDGVLIDSSELHWQAWQLLMQESPEFKIDRATFERGFGKRNDLILEDAMPSASVQMRALWADRKEELFRKSAKGNIQLLQGMESFLKKVSESNIPHIIASSTPVKNLELFLQTTVLGKYFDAYLSAEEVENGKPAPDIFIAAAHRLHFHPEDCVVFEDAPAGIQAGKSAGSFVVALETTHKRRDLFDYDLIYPSAEQLDLQEILNAYTLWKNGNCKHR